MFLGDVIVPLDIWQADRDSLQNKNGKLGVQLEPDQHPSEIADDLEKFDVVAINFPSFMDGRGYSYAKILRDQYGYKGEIRAVGDIMRDQLFYLQRCGFNAFEIKNGKNIEEEIKGLDDFSETYQVSADQKVPLYRRR
ncbi:DUF934 domain-containing protein [Emcibacter nanhaiensis]|uniref:DUF934 domain-containing protein n=2 Tax=Emcibacter nanhaiensis TaxID=1505037 RepID=A0A501PHH1_9PROT|nr:DUF934 domain-containing protein [Emcibacter nanhaiensis]